jgi:hypothetical protein
MTCPFHHSNRIGPDCSRGTDQGANFVVKHPLPSQVFDTALDCIGVPFSLGFSPEVIPKDCASTKNGSWVREKDRNQLDTASFFNNFQARQHIHPLYRDEVKNNNPPNPVHLTSLMDRKDTVLHFTEKKKSKLQSTTVSPIALKFFYHFERPQRVNQLLDGIDIHMDTRTEVRCSFPNKVQDHH